MLFFLLCVSSKMAMQNICYETPKNDKDVFIHPEISRIPCMALENKDMLQRCRITLNGVAFQTLRDKTREELLHKAIQYTNGIRTLLRKEPSQWDFTSRPSKDIPIIQTGHEPIFYHPGIWVKNHLAHHIAKRVNGIGINMVVDNDACTMGFLYAPALSENSLHARKIPLVDGKDRVAYEEIVFDDAAVLLRFRDEVLALLKKNSFNTGAFNGKQMGDGAAVQPLRESTKTVFDDMRAAFEDYIAHVVACHERGCVDMTGLLTAARVAMEGVFQIKNLEIPVSLMCNTDGFYHFFLHLLHNAEQFARIYNAKLSEYRTIHKIRSKANPLPDLNVGNNVTELPFWVWKQGEERKRCYLLSEGERLKITDGIHVVATLGKNEAGSKNMQKLRTLQEARIKLRPRAITTTMFSRLLFSDVFIHGIGGAKYDAITDEIIREFFGISPPSYVTNSATLFLPLNASDRDAGELQRVQRELKDMPHNPERYASEEILSRASFATLVKEKKRLLATIEGCGVDEKKACFNQIKTLNKLLFDQIRAEFLHKQNERNALMDGLASETAAKFREYPVCLFPTDYLRGRHTNVFFEG